MFTYDVAETARWMLREAYATRAQDHAVGASGRQRRKTRAEREREAARIDVLEELLWNAAGRAVERERLATDLARELAGLTADGA